MHDEGGEEHEGDDDGVACHADLEEEFVDVGVAEEVMEEVAVVDGECSHTQPKGVTQVHDDLVSQLLPVIQVGFRVGLPEFFLQEAYFFVFGWLQHWPAAIHIQLLLSSKDSNLS